MDGLGDGKLQGVQRGVTGLLVRRDRVVDNRLNAGGGEVGHKLGAIGDADHKEVPDVRGAGEDRR